MQRADTSGRQRLLFVSEFGKYPIPDTAYEIARGDGVASFKMRNESLEGACSRFDRLYGILSDRFEPVKISRRREGQKWFSPDLFARLKQTDDHLGVDLYVEDWSKHPDPHMRRGGIILNIYMRDLRLDEPARTLTCRNLAGCTSDMHRIRLEDGRRRRLSVREAARLQSFPDWYEFSGTKEQQFTMIGNAVPPMFSYKLAQSVISYLKLHEAHSAKHSALSDLAKRAVDPAIKAASLAVLAKVIS